MTPDIRTIAREALKAEHRRLSHDPGSPPLPNALADAVALAVCNEIRERMGNRADRLKNEEFHAVWRELSLLDEQIAAFQPETATPQPARKEDPFRAEYGYPQPAVSSVPVGEQDEKNHGAGLIHQPIPDLAETEQRPNRDEEFWNSFIRHAKAYMNSHDSNHLEEVIGWFRSDRARAVGYHGTQPLSEAGTSAQSASAKKTLPTRLSDPQEPT